MTFQNKVALVTGGSRGIGSAIVLALGREGCRVAFTFREDVSAARRVAGEVQEYGSKALYLQHDIRDLRGCERIVAKARDMLGEIDYLINNAGVIRDKPLYLMGAEEWSEVIDTNLTGTFALTRRVVTSMMKRRSGGILNIASTAGLHGIAGQTNYSSSKAGVIGFTRSLAREVGPFDVRVNAIAPGYIETDMMKGTGEIQKKKYIKNIPLGRFGKPKEVAQLALYLLSDSSCYITGQVFIIDGGLTS